MPILKKTDSFLAKRKTNGIVFRLDVAGFTRADIALVSIFAAPVPPLILPMPFFCLQYTPPGMFKAPLFIRTSEVFFIK